MESERFYLRLENLPWSASQQHVRDFFEGIDIPDGAMSFHSKDIFIAFRTEDDLNLAMKKNRCKILGKPVILSRVKKNLFLKLRFLNTKRVLHFKSKPSSKEAPSTKRIRPTFAAYVPKDEVFHAFNPVETEDKADVVRSLSLSEVPKVKRKIKPTLVDELSHCNEVFASSHCCVGLKKQKLNESYRMIPIASI